jgi:hypothetical protein
MARLRVMRTTTAGIVTDSAPKPGFLGAEGVSIPGCGVSTLRKFHMLTLCRIHHGGTEARR